MWYNLVKDFRYITVNSLLKKLKNILNIQGKKSAVLVTVFMILFAVVAPVLTLPLLLKAQGTSSEDTSNSCVIHSYVGTDTRGNQSPKQVIRTVQSSSIQLNKKIDNAERLWINEPIEVFFKVSYAQNSAWKQRYCNSSVKPRLRILAPAFVGQSSAISPEIIETVSDLKFDENNGLSISGTFKITNFQSILNDTYKNYINTRNEGYSKDFYFVLSFVEENFEKTKIVESKPFGVAPCDPGQECKPHTVENIDINSTPGVGDENVIPFSLLKFMFNSRVDPSSAYAKFLPESIKKDPYHNFIRMYIGADGKLVPVEIQAQVDLKSPTDKKFSISKNGPSTKVTMASKSGSAVQPKKVNGLVVGVVASNKVVSGKDSEAKCAKASTDTNYTIGTGNEKYNYNFCHFPTGGMNSAGDGVVMEAGKPGRILGVLLTNDLLQKLGSIKPVECKDAQGKVDPKGTECENVTVNMIQFYQGIGVEKTLFDDTSLAAVLTNPIIQAGWALYGSLDLVVSYNPPLPIYIQIYPSEEAWKANIDKQPIPTSVPKYAGVETSSGISEGSTGQSLYAFIVRVISVVITWLQTIIYAAFAYILVPVLNALLKVRPYKDTFVNIIYPGWLILRNLANIFFIVSLLVVGLKILFQQSAASTAKNFILRLVLMALLVNFSLVISQGIVGIADTVQSQFLPADSKIIEALGSKLMVEPLKNFREEVAGANDTFTDKDAEGSIADTVKPLVLLMLSLASFFSFAALAAFLLVRLVVLWVLYMTSPVAYVGYVMEETQTYAKQWWKEFLKYVIMTPVLVFFLNIAALMATLFSGQDNSIFEFSEGIAGDIVAATMTIISHFIVLFFIYVGMKFALSSGTIGAKTIVDYAKKGFDTFTSKPAKWAAGQAKEAAQTQWDRRFKGGMLDPKAHIGAFKEQVDKTTKTKMEKRLGSKANKLTPEGLYSNPKRALKYVLGGASAGTEGFQNEINAKRDEAAILTEAERDALTTALPTNQAKLNLKQNDMQAMDDGKLSLHMAETEILNKLDDKIRSLEESKLEEVAKLTRRGRISDADELGRDYDRQIASLTNVKTKIGDAMLASTDGKIVLDAETKDKVSVVFDADDVKAKLKDDVTDLENDINALTKDAERRNKYGYGVAGTNGAREIDFNRQMQLKNEAEKLEEQMNDHAMPVSLGARNARLTRESEAAKKIAHLEGEELRYAFKKAMADNNMDLAAAIAKKAAQEGDADMLLKEHGFKNNIEDFHKFINQKFASFGPSVRAQIGSEISALADKNGNAAIGKAYRVNNSGQLVGRSMQEQAKKVNTSIAKSPPEDVFKKKPTEISRQIGSNQHELYEGIVTNLNTMNKEKLKNMVRRMPAKTAKFILNASNKNLLSLDVKLALEKTANKS